MAKAESTSDETPISSSTASLKRRRGCSFSSSDLISAPPLIIRRCFLTMRAEEKDDERDDGGEGDPFGHLKVVENGSHSGEIMSSPSTAFSRSRCIMTNEESPLTVALRIQSERMEALRLQRSGGGDGIDEMKRSSTNTTRKSRYLERSSKRQSRVKTSSPTKNLHFSSVSHYSAHKRRRRLNRGCPSRVDPDVSSWTASRREKEDEEPRGWHGTPTKTSCGGENNDASESPIFLRHRTWPTTTTTTRNDTQYPNSTQSSPSFSSSRRRCWATSEAAPEFATLSLLRSLKENGLFCDGGENENAPPVLVPRTAPAKTADFSMREPREGNFRDDTDEEGRRGRRRGGGGAKRAIHLSLERVALDPLGL